MSYNGSSHDAYFERELKRRELELKARELNIKEALNAELLKVLQRLVSQQENGRD